MDSQPMPWGSDTMIERQDVLSQVYEALQQPGLVAIVGPPGIGKSTLAQQIARKPDMVFPGGVHFVEAPHIDRGPNNIVSHLRDRLGATNNTDRRLIIVDGVDETSGASDILLPLLTNLVRSDHQLRVLVTSRSPVPTAHSVIKVAPLTYPEVARLFRSSGVAESDIPSLTTVVGGNPLAARLLGALLRRGDYKVPELVEFLGTIDTTGVFLPDGKQVGIGTPPPQPLRIELAEINETLLRKIAASPSLMYDLSPRKFEELVAELLTRQGYTVDLTPPSKDGGKDIYVARRNDLGTFLYLVECKKYSLDNPVGVDIVRALYGTVQAEHATAGILVTTSRFTKGATDFQKQVEYQLSLRDYAQLHSWLHDAIRGGGPHMA